MPSPTDTRSGKTKTIAARTLLDSNGATIEVRVYEPIPDDADENGNWRCDFSIKRGSAPEEIKHAIGVDSLQALILAVQGIRYYLEPESAKLSWLGQAGVMGIPLHISDENPHKTAMFRHLIEAEVEREALFWERVSRSKRTPK